VDISGAAPLKTLERLGFSNARTVGGNRRVMVPMYRNLVVGTLKSILRQAAVSLDDFVDAL
jgi:predicted RNA binding protein YcfA (HicA-like mRNA interferase family)